MKTHAYAVAAAVFVLALLVRLAAMFALPVHQTPWSDGAQYVNLAASLADGKGYVLMEGNYWPGRPTIIRAPGWPAILSIPFRMVPKSCRWRVAQLTAALFDSANALLIVALAAGLGAGLGVSAAAGLLYAANPVMAGMCTYPACEPAGIFFLLLAFLALVRWGLTRLWPALLAGLMFGLACVVRPNWLLLAVLSAGGLVWVERHAFGRAALGGAVLVLACFLPLAPWLVRNAVVFERFPVLGAGGGETLYGGNNDVAARVGGPYWGYLVFTDDIPGERPLRELAAAMNEQELDRYFFGAGVHWVLNHPAKLPGLMVGKLRRAYLPLPRTRSADAWLGAAYRWAIYGLAAAGGVYAMRRRVLSRIPARAKAIAWVALAAHLIIVLAFCGLLRFVVAWEVLLTIPAGYAAMCVVRRLWGHESRINEHCI